MSAFQVDNDGDMVLLLGPEGEWCRMTTRAAFDLVTDLLASIDRARAHAAQMRQEGHVERF